MTKIIKKAVGAHGNKLEFYTVNHIESDHIIVRDHSAQMERRYVVGQTQELDNFEQRLIVSQAQVINAWSNGTVWF